MLRVRFLKVLCMMLCVLLAVGLTGVAAAGEMSVMVNSWEKLNEAAEAGATEVIVYDDITFIEGNTTVVFHNAVVIQSGGEGPYPNGKGYTINGNGKQILRIESEDEGGPLKGISEVRNLTFKYGDAPENMIGPVWSGCGGAVFVHGDLLVETCDFMNNHAENGGAVYTTGNLALYECSFLWNLADENGGAVYADGENVTLTGGMITKNAAFMPDSGGGIYAPNGAVDGDVDTVTDNYPDDIVQGR